MLKRLMMSVAAVALLASPALSQSKNAPGNLEKLGEFKSTGTAIDIPDLPAPPAGGIVEQPIDLFA